MRCYGDNLHWVLSLAISPDVMLPCSLLILAISLPTIISLTLFLTIFFLSLSPSRSLYLSLSVHLSLQLFLSNSISLSLSVHLIISNHPISPSTSFHSFFHFNEQFLTWLMWLSIPASLAISGAEMRSGVPISGIFFNIPFSTCIGRRVRERE